MRGRGAYWRRLRAAKSTCWGCSTPAGGTAYHQVHQSKRVQLGAHQPACLVPGEPEETASQLQSAVDRHLDNAGVVLAQAILPMRDVVNALRLTRAGYQHLADLDYLVSPRDGFPTENPQSSLQFEPSTRGDAPQWQKLLDRTYQGSLDCSDVDGVRRIDDVLDSYQRTGVYRPEWWIFARYHGQDVGCALLADHPEHNQAELMYIGIVPEMRGRGWGLEVTRHAQWIAWCAGRERLVLAVDDGNWPAQNIYEKAGFDIWDRRSVFIRAAAPAVGDAEVGECSF